MDDAQNRDRPDDFKVVEFNFMKQTKNQNSGKNATGAFTGSALKNTIPRVDILDVNLTIMDVKRKLYNQMKAIWPKDHKIHESEEVLNEALILHVYDNLPYYIDKRRYKTKATCEFCKTSHGLNNTCDLKIGDESANTFEAAQKLRLRDVF